MYYIFGFDQVVKSIADAIGHSSQEGFIFDDKAKSAYCDFLNKVSVFELPITWQEIRLVDLNGLDILAPKFCQRKKEFFDENSEILKKRLSNGFFDVALNRLEKQELMLYSLANFIIKIVLA